MCLGRGSLGLPKYVGETLPLKGFLRRALGVGVSPLLHRLPPLRPPCFPPHAGQKEAGEAQACLRPLQLHRHLIVKPTLSRNREQLLEGFLPLPALLQLGWV